jgi:hypothetical protein
MQSLANVTARIRRKKITQAVSTRLRNFIIIPRTRACRASRNGGRRTFTNGSVSGGHASSLAFGVEGTSIEI